MAFPDHFPPTMRSEECGIYSIVSLNSTRSVWCVGSSREGATPTTQHPGKHSPTKNIALFALLTAAIIDIPKWWNNVNEVVMKGLKCLLWWF